MRRTVPPSFGCLTINKTFGAEAAEEMYRSVRLELNFGKLRPETVRQFMDRIGRSKFGKKCECIFPHQEVRPAKDQLWSISSVLKRSSASTGLSMEAKSWMMMITKTT